MDFDTYAAISQRIKSILREFSPVCEDSGLDEAFLDITHREEAPERIAAAIKQRIKAATGLSCSVGIGPKKLLAKLASDLGKPDGLTVLTEADIAEKVWPLPVRKLRLHSGIAAASLRNQQSGWLALAPLIPGARERSGRPRSRHCRCARGAPICDVRQ